MSNSKTDVAIIGAGIVGISVASYLKRAAPELGVALIDRAAPMALTSAQSGENYRNWWPHPVMKQFTDHSIDLMEDWARETDNAIQMTRRGYLLATRTADADALKSELLAGYQADGEEEIRLHETPSTYEPPISADWRQAPDGVDMLCGSSFIASQFPWIDPEVQSLVHIRRAGAISSQQMGQAMLDEFRAAGGNRIMAEVTGIERSADFLLSLSSDRSPLRAGKIVNAAGPFINEIAAMLDITLPVTNVLQQKIAFEDVSGAIPRDMPFGIDLDPQVIDWSDEEKNLLGGDEGLAWLAAEMPGAIHCRPDGGEGGKWVKLGWAFNEAEEAPTNEPRLFDHFPEIVLRGAARLSPALKRYYGRLPKNRIHYGGYYTQTAENWPLIGPMGVDGAFVAGALSGFGTMAACAAGELTAAWILENKMPDYASALSMARYEDAELMAALHAQNSRGML
ncbi:MAG TPA: FAD-dependent oxidoreductase [Rhodospirillaceae bacterium]|nr:FAD-dependent oxidoreductase [Rhodospirillaceae bacterium]MBL25059.1 FAD-dependent oxidoreductase [Rhodospirillaceae bacterium]HAA93576.1 FAD-dependent oxidoreductase [Rhodospirillaceae bacterium]HAT34976.1 FAD-dependent oxidoreductase [Rhodospirillaceae bacterium]